MTSTTAVAPAFSANGTVGCTASTTAAPQQPHLMGKAKIASLTSLGSAISCASLVASVYMLPFWTDVIGVSPRFMGIVIVCAKVTEAFSVVSVGIFSDNCRVRLGRRRPFLIACMPAAVLYALLFNPPQAVVASGSASAWVFSVGLSFYAVWPYLTVCHSSWCAEFCHDYAERNVLYGFRYFWGTIGTITGAVLPLIVAAASGLSEKALDERKQINNSIGYIVAVIIAALAFFVLVFVSEKSHQNNSEMSTWKALVSWIMQACGAIRHSHLVRVHMLMTFFYDIALAYAVSFLPYMTSRIQMLQTTLVLGSYVVLSLLCIPLWLKISQYFQKHHVFAAACALQSGCLMAAGLVICYYDSHVFVSLSFFLSGAETVRLLGTASHGCTVFSWSSGNVGLHAC
jgi:GPH family glycoside/pentoside/hexuronide:cation symporter